jgi:hypothetical protein
MILELSVCIMTSVQEIIVVNCVKMLILKWTLNIWDVDWIQLAQGGVQPCEHGNEPLGSMEGGDFLPAVQP